MDESQKVEFTDFASLGNLDDDDPAVNEGKQEKLRHSVRISARCEKTWGWSAETSWFCRARYVGREYHWMEIDTIALRERWPGAASDATHGENEIVVVLLPLECLQEEGEAGCGLDGDSSSRHSWKWWE